MSYTELEHGYQGLRKAARPTQFYVGALPVIVDAHCTHQDAVESCEPEPVWFL
jgi:hypothetical protein